MYIFDGIKLAAQRELLLKERVSSKLKIAAILFKEDSGSKIYTRLKSEAASRVGIEYEVHEFSLADFVMEGNNFVNEKVFAKIKELNNDSNITGIIVQKPWRKTWIKSLTISFNDADKSSSFEEQKIAYNNWWRSLTSQISEKKDVDGLHLNTIEQIKAGTWKKNNKVLPATCRAVLTIMSRAGELENFSDEKIVIIGKSDLLGIPLFHELQRQGKNVELLDSNGLKVRLESGQKLLDAKVLVSATGIKNLITGDLLSNGVTVIDVGEPKPDVEISSVSNKAIFITPVPGGVGPMTVISLLENCADLVIQGKWR
ncbi:bifunctional 5,10-methylenetetrahydrofolate dehydrogenase/5,10-methenyltetrahydrofolate cyclohydrolase [Candidatus Woesebacteria bacterium]|nr:bifunctional 5,10-methylenetetrahydrofolate dehydrogenase/5,10-methenyltetrahydrofolate cyclohydrolase [Candidatus Woesebacteria bacterium]